MGTAEIFKIATAIVTSVGSSALIIAALSGWLGKVWAGRILEKDRLKYSAELEKIKSQLQSEADTRRITFSLYFEGQFKLYNELWLALSELSNEVEQLWESATRPNLKSFIHAVRRAKKQIRNSAILIEREHYDQILENLSAFEEYQIGKERLITGRAINSISEFEIRDLIEQNRKRREEILEFTQSMLQVMRIQIGGRS